MNKLTMQELTTTALLGVLILISGSFKIPSPIAGGEFQLSAPEAGTNQYRNGCGELELSASNRRGNFEGTRDKN